MTYENKISVSIDRAGESNEVQSPPTLPSTPRLVELTFDKVFLAAAAALVLFPLQECHQRNKLIAAKQEDVRGVNLDILQTNIIELSAAVENLSDFIILYSRKTKEEKEKSRSQYFELQVKIINYTKFSQIITERPSEKAENIRDKLSEMRLWVEQAEEHRLTEAEDLAASLQELVYHHLKEVADSVD